MDFFKESATFATESVTVTPESGSMEKVSSLRNPDTVKDVKDDLLRDQIALEEQASTLGISRYFKDVEKHQLSGSEDETFYGRRLIRLMLEPTATLIREYTERMAVGAPGRRAVAAKMIYGMDPHVLAFIALRFCLSGLTKGARMAATAASVGMAVEMEKRMNAFREIDRKYYEAVVNGPAIKGMGQFKSKRVYAMKRTQEVIPDARWTPQEHLQVGTRLVELVIEATGLFEVVNRKDGPIKTTTYLHPTDKAVEWVRNSNSTVSSLAPLLEPMVVPPRPWTSPWDGGYLTTNIPPMPLVKTSEKAYLKSLADVEMPIVYEAINSLQETAWQVNQDILKVMVDAYESGYEIGGFVAEGGIPLPIKPEDIATNAEARLKYRIDASRVHRRNVSLRGTRLATGMAIRTAQKFAKYPEIYMPYQLDFRSRMYAIPSLTPQGSDYTKALLRFANGKALGEEGVKWLAVSGANHYGVDKVSFEDRVKWVLENEEAILASANDPLSVKFWQDADAPWQFLAFCMEWKGVCEQGEDFVSHLPVNLDGSCSGLQHYSAMLRDERGGAAVNLVPMDTPADVYRLVAEEVMKLVEADAASGTKDEPQIDPETGEILRVKFGTQRLAAEWLAFGINRKTTKRSVMTLPYGSGQFGFAEHLREDILSPAYQTATDIHGNIDRSLWPFGDDGYAASMYLARHIYSACQVVLSKAMGAMSWLQKVAKEAAKTNGPLRWTTPVGFPVTQAYRQTDVRTVKTSLLGKTWKATIHLASLDLDARKQAQGIAPNFVHSCDAAHMMLTVVRAKQRGINSFSMIHDSFGTHAADIPVLFDTIRESMVEIYDTVDVLQEFVEEVKSQIANPDVAIPPAPERGSLDLSLVLQSRYAFA